MSKSPNLLLPGLGISALVLGLAYGVGNRQYGADKIEMLETRLDQVEAQATASSEKATLAEARAADLQAEIAAVQEAASQRLAQGASLTAPAPTSEAGYGIGRPALPEEIAAWDVDVLPDGRGLPEGRGDVWTGEEVFADACASCHGDFAEGVDNWPVLAGGFDTLGDKDPVKTVGSYWPYLSTVWDYVHRSMPFGAAQTLSDDEVYAIVAYILYSNDLVDDDFELSHENFADFVMHNAEGFVIDDRAALEYSEWRVEPCMENCKDEVQVTMRSVFLVEEPETGTESVMNHASVDDLPTFTAAGPSFIPTAIPTAAPKADAVTPESEPAAAAPADENATLLAAGQKVFKKCQSCHQIGEGAKNRAGPVLTGVMDRTMGGVEGFKYSSVFADAAASGRVWDDAEMAAFLEKPKTHMKGTKMSFAGLRKAEEIEAIIAYLRSFDG